MAPNSTVEEEINLVSDWWGMDKLSIRVIRAVVSFRFEPEHSQEDAFLVGVAVLRHQRGHARHHDSCRQRVQRQPEVEHHLEKQGTRLWVATAR